MKKILRESGIRDINQLRERYTKAEIYFHQDLDGVTTAIAMKKYLEDNGIDVVGAHVIQYGDKEFSIKKNDATGDVMPVLVDFAHGKPMFVIHTDHHDRQAGAEETKSTSFRQSRSNVATISQVVSPKELFPSSDILLINTVDSADFARQNISPEDVVNYLFRVDKEKSLQTNKMLLGLVINKLLLAFKNKPGFLEMLVMNSEPSLLSILNNIRSWMKSTQAPSQEELQKNAEEYVQQMKSFPTVSDNIIFQYGGGNMFKPGSYDRYTPFRNNPEADFMIMAWPMGLVQASCNPYKKERALKGVDLGEIKNEVLENFKSELESQRISFGTIKRIAEMDAQEKSVGFTLKDMLAIYGNAPSFTFRGTERQKKYLDHLSKKLFKNLDTDIKKLFNLITVNGYDVIQANSGGHKCITNISGINFLYSKSKFQDTERKTRGSYVDLLKDIQAKFVEVLKNKIEKQKNLQEFTISKKTIKNKF